MWYKINNGVVWITIYQNRPAIPFKLLKDGWIDILLACLTHKTKKITNDNYYINILDGFVDIGCIRGETGGYALVTSCKSCSIMFINIALELLHSF
jgi:hypothetical protein